MQPEITGYSFPNDIHILWGLMNVIYPYCTGLVAGLFIVSSMYYVFRREEMRPVGRLSMIASSAFLLVAPLPLVLHIRQPLRAINTIITPHFTSAMAAFSVIYTVFFVILALQIWLVYRRDIILLARRSRGFKRKFFATYALGVYDISDKALHIDRRATVVFASLGIPVACFLHGYVGFMFGSVKANYWWSTPLMPVIFLFSALLSGIAMVIVLYQSVMKLTGRPIDGNCVQALCRWLWFVTILTVTIELLEIINLAYERSEEWMVIGTLLSTKLAFSFIGVQMVFGSLIPIILLAIVVLMKPYLTDPLRNTMAYLASLILLIQVFAMRWNVVIGGQLFSKSLRGFRESYVPELLGMEGLAMAVLVLISPFILMAVFNRFLPLYESPKEAEKAP